MLHNMPPPSTGRPYILDNMPSPSTGRPYMLDNMPPPSAGRPYILDNMPSPSAGRPYMLHNMPSPSTVGFCSTNQLLPIRNKKALSKIFFIFSKKEERIKSLNFLLNLLDGLQAAK